MFISWLSFTPLAKNVHFVHTWTHIKGISFILFCSHNVFRSFTLIILKITTCLLFHTVFSLYWVHGEGEVSQNLTGYCWYDFFFHDNDEKNVILFHSWFS